MCVCGGGETLWQSMGGCSRDRLVERVCLLGWVGGGCEAMRGVTEMKAGAGVDVCVCVCVPDSLWVCGCAFTRRGWLHAACCPQLATCFPDDPAAGASVCLMLPLCWCCPCAAVVCVYAGA